MVKTSLRLKFSGNPICIRKHYNKEGGLTRDLISNCLDFTRAQFFSGHAHSQRVYSAAAGPLTTAL